MTTPVHQQSPTINARYPLGLKGWLLVFWILLVLKATEILFYQNLGGALLYLLRVRNWENVTLPGILPIAISLGNVLLLALLAWQLNRLDYRFLRNAKIYATLVFVTITFVQGSYYIAHPEIFDGAEDILWVILYAAIVPAAILGYLNKSKRVRNTFMFAMPTLPTSVDCPFCLSTLTLDDDERASKRFVCPDCSHSTSREVFAA